MAFSAKKKKRTKRHVRGAGLLNVLHRNFFKFYKRTNHYNDQVCPSARELSGFDQKTFQPLYILSLKHQIAA
jgi:hypothetical protein